MTDRPADYRAATAPTDSHSSILEKFGVGCLVLFFLPFCAFGVGAAIGAIGFAIAGDWAAAGFLALFGVVFEGVGFGLLFATLFGRRRAKEIERLKQQHPEEPWLWRPDWAAGRLECSSRAGLIAAWSFSLFWNSIAFTVPLFIIPQAWREGEKFVLLILIFPIIGLGLLAWALRVTLQHRKYGVSVLRLTTVPGVVGRLLQGVIIARTLIHSHDGFHVTLSCVNRIVTGSGEDRTTREEVLWQEERTITEPHEVRGATAVPIAFRIPDDVRESDDSDASNAIFWRVEVSAAVPGVDYQATFDVPVFRTVESSVPLTPAEEEALKLAGDDEDEPLRQRAYSRIRVNEGIRRTEIFFPAARNIGHAFGITAFFIIWTAVVVALREFGAPLIFPIVFGLFDLLLAYGVASAWLGTTHVVCEHTGIWVRSGILGFGRIRQVPADEIDDIDLKIGMHVGKRPYYDIKIVRSSGKSVHAGRAIRDKREARWLVERMASALDLE
jgi:hypothetical protein